MKRLSLVLLFLLQIFTCLGQEFDNVSATRRMGRNTTYEEAVNLATEAAKALAVSKKCGSSIGYFSLTKMSDKGRSFSQKIFSGSHAMVRLFDRRVEVSGRRVTVTIDGEVCAPPVPLAFEVDEVKNTYTSLENMTFGVSFFRDSYLKIFWFDEETGEGGLLYPQPRSYAFSGKFAGDNRRIHFPLYGDDNYFKQICPEARTVDDMREEVAQYGRLRGPKIRKEDLPNPGECAFHAPGRWDETKEKNVVIVFVATNSNIPYPFSEVNEENFLDWWFGLPYSEKSLPIKKHVTLKM